MRVFSFTFTEKINFDSLFGYSFLHLLVVGVSESDFIASKDKGVSLGEKSMTMRHSRVGARARIGRT